MPRRWLARALATTITVALLALTTGTVAADADQPAGRTPMPGREGPTSQQPIDLPYPYLVNDLLRRTSSAAPLSLFIHGHFLECQTGIVLAPNQRYLLYDDPRQHVWTSHQVPLKENPFGRDTKIVPVIRLFDLDTGSTSVLAEGACGPAWGGHQRIAYVQGDTRAVGQREPFLGRIVVRESWQHPAETWTAEVGAYRVLA